MQIQNSQFLNALEVQDRFLNQNDSGKAKEVNSKGLSFYDILNQKTEPADTGFGLKFSKHATSRLAQRNIDLSDAQLERLEEGVAKADRKGIQDSLVLMDDLAFIVNVKSNTVITAMDQTRADENIFTNIDGAVII
ncbi:MAG: flagellar protein [Lachnospiraceae bacterium]|nr:flagellar protein [Candidatus Merdinaster equi]